MYNYLYKSSLTLNDLYDTTCITHNQLSNFYSVYTIVQVVHTKSIKIVLTDYSAFRISSKMTEERAAAAVKEKEKKKKSLWETFA